jgi:hypothetical protein
VDETKLTIINYQVTKEESKLLNFVNCYLLIEKAVIVPLINNSARQKREKNENEKNVVWITGSNAGIHHDSCWL